MTIYRDTIYAAARPPSRGMERGGPADGISRREATGGAALGRGSALGAARGRALWEFVPPLRSPLKSCCLKANRGAAFGRVARPLGGADPRAYVATLDARLWALSATTGQPEAGFGDGVGP